MPESTALVPFELPENLLQELMGMFPDHTNNDLTEGVALSFAVVTFRGKVWRVRYKGEDRVIKLPTGDPASSIIAVLVKSSPAISKLYYPKNYTEGDDAPPLCFSLDGVRPDINSTERQSPTCAACPHNVWGSRITENNSKAKACADNRRVAIVPFPDIANEMFGGPMLLRIPPMSLQELWRFGNALKQSGLPYQAVVVKISFDYDVAYPKLLFQAVKALTPEQAAQVRELMDSDTVLRMLMEPVPGDETGAANDSHAPTEAAGEAVQAAVAKPAPATTAKPKAAPAPAQKAAEPKQEPVETAAQLGLDISMGDPEPAPTKKPSPAKAAVAPADVVNSELTSMITGLLGS